MGFRWGDSICTGGSTAGCCGVGCEGGCEGGGCAALCCGMQVDCMRIVCCCAAVGCCCAPAGCSAVTCGARATDALQLTWRDAPCSPTRARGSKRSSPFGCSTSKAPDPGVRLLRRGPRGSLEPGLATLLKLLKLLKLSLPGLSTPLALVGVLTSIAPKSSTAAMPRRCRSGCDGCEGSCVDDTWVCEGSCVDDTWVCVCACVCA